MSAASKTIQLLQKLPHFFFRFNSHEDLLLSLLRVHFLETDNAPTSNIDAVNTRS